MLSVVIPTYNERDNIAPLALRLDKALHDYEIIFVDDNSPDGTADLAESLSKKLPLRVLRRPGKAGLTSAVAEGVSIARGELIVVMDADLSHPPEKVPQLVEALRNCDLSVGSRMAKGGGVEKWPYHRRLISKAAELMARAVVPCRTSDPLSGFFAAKKAVFAGTKFRTRGYKLLLNILADNPGLRLADVPYVFRDRHAGKTKLGPMEMLSFLLDLLRIRFRRN